MFLYGVTAYFTTINLYVRSKIVSLKENYVDNIYKQGLNYFIL